MAILSQLIDAKELEQLTPETLRALILNLNRQIEQGRDEKLYVSIEANIIGVLNDEPAGDPEWRDVDYQGVKSLETLKQRPKRVK